MAYWKNAVHHNVLWGVEKDHSHPSQVKSSFVLPLNRRHLINKLQHEILDKQRNFSESISSFVIKTVPLNDLHCGPPTSSVIMMTKFGPRLNIGTETCSAMLMQFQRIDIIIFFGFRTFWSPQSDLWHHDICRCPGARPHIEGLVQERRNSSASAMGLRLSCTNPSILGYYLVP